MWDFPKLTNQKSIYYFPLLDLEEVFFPFEEELVLLALGLELLRLLELLVLLVVFDFVLLFAERDGVTFFLVLVVVVRFLFTDRFPLLNAFERF